MEPDSQGVRKGEDDQGKKKKAAERSKTSEASGILYSMRGHMRQDGVEREGKKKKKKKKNPGWLFTGEGRGRG